MSQINVAFNSFEEMKEFARELLKGENTAPVYEVSAKAVAETVNHELVAPKAQQEPPVQQDSKAEAQPEENIPDGKSYTLVDVRAALAALNKAGKKDRVQELINSFGAEKLSQIGEEHYAELMQKAGEI